MKYCDREVGLYYVNGIISQPVVPLTISALKVQGARPEALLI